MIVGQPGDDKRRFAAATARNRDPILEVLRRALPLPGRVLEVASGTGEHAVHFAAHLDVEWVPSDPEPENRDSIAAWIAHSGATRVLPPLDLDVRREWPAGPYDAIFCANMIHIAPWEVCEALLAGAGCVLRQDGVLAMYGPFLQGGHTAPSNAAFDASLRSRDPAWGVRDLDVVARVAATHGLLLEDVVEMPANNLTVVYRRT